MHRLMLGLAVALALGASAWSDPPKGLYFDVLPVTRDGHIFMPMRSIFEWIGAQIKFDRGVVTATKGPSTLTLTVGSRMAVLAGKDFAIEAEPFMENDRLYVPLKIAGDAFGVWIQPEGRVVQLSVPQEGKSAQLAIPPDPRSHLGKIWKVIAQHFGLPAPVTPAPPAEAGKPAETPETLPAPAPKPVPGVAGVRISADSREDTKGEVHVAVLFKNGTTAEQVISLELERTGWKIKDVRGSAVRMTPVPAVTTSDER